MTDFPESHPSSPADDGEVVHPARLPESAGPDDIDELASASLDSELGEHERRWATDERIIARREEFAKVRAALGTPVKSSLASPNSEERLDAALAAFDRRPALDTTEPHAKNGPSSQDEHQGVPITPLGPRRVRPSRSLAVLTTMAAAIVLILGVVGLWRATSGTEYNATHHADVAAPTREGTSQPNRAAAGQPESVPPRVTAGSDREERGHPGSANPATQPSSTSTSAGKPSTTLTGQPDLGILTTGPQLRETVRITLPSAGRTTVSTASEVSACQPRSIAEATVPGDRLRLSASAIWLGRPTAVFVYEATTTPNLYLIEVRAVGTCELLLRDTT